MNQLYVYVYVYLYLYILPLESPTPPPSHSSRSSQSTELSSLLYSSFPLAIYFTNGRVYMLASHSTTLAWEIPWTEEPGRLQSMGSRRVGHSCVTSLFTFMHWRKKWQPTPVFLPGESQRQGSLVGCRLWGRTESDTTDAT